MGWLKKVLGIIRKVLNKGHDYGIIPSQDHNITSLDLNKPHDPTFPDIK